MNFMVLNQLARTLIKDLFCIYIYIDLQIFINKFQLREAFLSPFIKIMILWKVILCRLQMYSKKLLHHCYLHQFERNIMID
jgi:hypothetical protein